MIQAQQFRLVRRRWWGDLTIARGVIERGKDKKWGYELKGANDRMCAISVRRYPSQGALVADLRVDFPACRVVVS